MLILRTTLMHIYLLAVIAAKAQKEEMRNEIIPQFRIRFFIFALYNLGKKPSSNAKWQHPASIDRH